MNRMTFLHTKSPKITFLTSEHYTSRSTSNIIKELQTVTNMYKERGVNINLYHGENAFNINALRKYIRPEVFHKKN